MLMLPDEMPMTPSERQAIAEAEANLLKNDPRAREIKEEIRIEKEQQARQKEQAAQQRPKRWKKRRR